MEIIKTGFILSVCLLTLFSAGSACAQEKTQMVRMAKLQIHPDQLESYKAILKEEIEASICVEPGVLTLYAVSEKKNPTYITIFETYASVDAYQSHIKTPHFIKYKTTTEKMIISLELVECDTITLGAKGK